MPKAFDEADERSGITRPVEIFDYRQHSVIAGFRITHQGLVKRP